MNNKVNEQKPEWPREVTVKQSLESIAAELGDDYDEDDDNGLVADAIMTSTTVIEIDSWEDLKSKLPAGYELAFPSEKIEYSNYLEFGDERK